MRNGDLPGSNLLDAALGNAQVLSETLLSGGCGVPSGQEESLYSLLGQDVSQLPLS